VKGAVRTTDLVKILLFIGLWAVLLTIRQPNLDRASRKSDGGAAEGSKLNVQNRSSMQLTLLINAELGELVLH